MLPLPCQDAVWKRNNMYRLGVEYRTAESRFVHVDKMGWFVRLRGEFHTTPGLTTSSGLAGPFPSQSQANTFLQYIIHRAKTVATKDA